MHSIDGLESKQNNFFRADAGVARMRPGDRIELECFGTRRQNFTETRNLHGPFPLLYAAVTAKHPLESEELGVRA